MRSAQELAEGFLREGIQTILFARSRVRVELILTKLQQMIKHTFGKKNHCWISWWVFA